MFWEIFFIQAETELG